MVGATTQLKRKGEETTPQRKSKKQRKSDGGSIEAGAATPGAPATPKANTTPKAQSSSTAKTGKTPSKNGNTVDEPTATAKVQANSVNIDVDAQIKPEETPRKSSQKQRKKEQRNGTADNGGDGNTKDDKAQTTAMQPLTQAQVEKALKNQEQKQLRKQKTKATQKWAYSPPQGGWFLPADPIFSPDEKYLILANIKSLQIYSTETSLLANILPVGGKGVLTAYALSSSKANLVYVADSDGLITLWDWVDGTKIGRWDIGAPVRNMAVVTRPGSDEDLVYCHEGDNSEVVNVHALRTKSQDAKTELKRVLKASSTICGIQVLLQGKYVVLSTKNSVLVGKRVKPTQTAVQDFEYIWREFTFSKHVTTFNAYHRARETSAKAKKASQDQRDVLDIAVGEESGVVFLFEDILTTFAAIETTSNGKKKNTDNAESLRPKRYHWHRDAVGAVKWSLDGNYIISGGEETVLTIWQLATGKPQHLPHLTAAIENIVVSPSGTSYALTLANNSVVVLSTTELEAKTHIVGVQSRRVDLQQQFQDRNATRLNYDIFHPVPMAINPAAPNEVLLAVPSSQPRYKNDSRQPEPYLQTFDLANHRAKTRQALTRNHATEPNVAPEGDRIKEPDTRLIQISHDGEWLATVDEWVPPVSDTSFLNEGVPEFKEEERLNRREVYLKFWRRSEQHDQWKLESRIDAPHFFEDVCSHGRVFDLVADPSGTGFATVGEDHVVRIWRPKTRRSDGVVVRGADKKGLVTWLLDRCTTISDHLDVLEGSQQPLHPLTSRLAFSTDGSVLAVATSWASDSDLGVTHLIDTHSATIQRSMTEVDVTALSGLGFVGQYLVFVAGSLTVWDMVLDELVYCVPIHTPSIGRTERIPLIRFAVNDADNTFAIALPQFKKKAASASTARQITSTLAIYDPNHSAPIWTNTSPITLALAARKGERGYIALDSVSCIMAISPTSSGLQLLTPPPEEKAELRTAYEVEDVDETADSRIGPITLTEDLSQDLNEDAVVFNAQQLQDVLDHGPVPPPPQGLFSAVLALVGRPGRIAG